MLTSEEIDHIARLARLELDHEHKEKFKKELSSILAYIAQLDAVDTAGIQPLYQVTGLTDQTRADEYRGDFVMNAELTRLLIDQAPAHQGRLVKVKAVRGVIGDKR